jgi:hypothetical protein
MGDWHIFTDAAHEMLRGGNPYDLQGVYHAPWLFVIVMFIAWLPQTGMIVLAWLTLAFAAWYKRKPLLIPVVGLSLPFLILIRWANVDWLALFGVLGVGHFQPLFLTVKPQATGLALVAYLNRDRWRFLSLFVIGLVLGFLLYHWPFNVLDSREEVLHMGHNWSLWRTTWPLGIVALWLAWRRQSVEWGVVASVALSPYWALYSLVPLIFVVAAKDLRLGLLLSVASWGFAFF